MTKPDDIPQDIWDAAEAADREADAAFGESLDDPHQSVEEAGCASVAVIARAILAEREACAAIAQRGGIPGHMVAMTVAASIAGAIRRLTPPLR